MYLSSMNSHRKTTLRQYRLFLKICELHSVSKAAAFFRITQSAATQQIDALEKEIGKVLFERERGSSSGGKGRAGLVPTQAAMRLIEAISKVVEADDILQEQMKEVSEGKNTFRLAVFKSIAVNWVPSIVKAFEKTFPDYELELFDGTYREIEEMIENGTVDAGFVSLPCSLQVPVFTVADDALLAALPCSHPLAALDGEEKARSYREMPAVPAELFGKETMVSLVDRTNRDARMYLHNNGIEPRIRYQTADDYAMLSMVESELGICIVHELVAQTDSHHIALRRLQPAGSRKIGLAFSLQGAQSEQMQRIGRFIQEQIAQMAKSSGLGTE